jgi:CheY-like chemotaxis protein/anti-sigma regulatory factor (Ser/Thr protein kinase)
MAESAVILLVEDEQSLLDGIADLLEMADTGYQLTVLTATNGVEGLEVLSRHIPDLIVSDIMMPKMGGIEFLRSLRQNPEWVHIPVIFLSARGTRQDVLKGRLSGAELYITKPFDNEELLRMVRSQLGRAFELRDDRRRRMEELRRNIIQLLNHEFRTPLTYVTAYYEMLAESLSLEDVDNLQEYLRGIQVGTVRLAGLVEDLIEVVELKTGEAAARFTANARPISNMGQLLKESLDSWRRREVSAPVILHDLVPESLPVVLGDWEAMSEVLERLLDNAIKFSLHKRENKPEVWLEAGTRNDQVYFSVKDNGIGFPDQVRHQIFDLFYQHNRTEIEQQGSGAGLTIVKGLIDLHGGAIEVDSKVGMGTTMTVLVPIYDARGISALPARTASRPPKSATVLIVEDEWYLLDGLRELLEIIDDNYDIRVITARNGREGLEVLRKTQPDLIISDIMMPYLDGYEFLDRVRQNPAWVHIPFIFLTAKGERRDILRGHSSGAEQYITKPYDSDELLDLVVTQLDRYFQMQSVVRQNTDELRRGILELLRPEFRLPLTSVTDYSQRLATGLERVESDEELKESLIGIQAASNRISRLVEDFIFLAELKTGEVVSAFKWRSRPMNVNAVLIDASRSLGQFWEATHIVERSLDKSLENTQIDYDLMLKGFLRLLEVAAALVQVAEPARIRMVSLQHGHEIVIRIGVLDGTLDPKIAGEIGRLLSDSELAVMGLSQIDSGLAIVKGILDLHHGRIELEEQENGCIFCIRLPVYVPEDEPEAVN